MKLTLGIKELTGLVQYTSDIFEGMDESLNPYAFLTKDGNLPNKIMDLLDEIAFREAKKRLNSMNDPEKPFTDYQTVRRTVVNDEVQYTFELSGAFMVQIFEIYQMLTPSMKSILKGILGMIEQYGGFSDRVKKIISGFQWNQINNESEIQLDRDLVSDYAITHPDKIRNPWKESESEAEEIIKTSKPWDDEEETIPDPSDFML